MIRISKFFIFFTLTIFLFINSQKPKPKCSHKNKSDIDQKCKEMGKTMVKHMKNDIDHLIDKCKRGDNKACSGFCMELMNSLSKNIILNDNKQACKQIVENYFRNVEDEGFKKLLIEFIRILPSQIIIKDDSEFYKYFDKIVETNNNFRRLESFIERSVLCEFIMDLFGYDTDDC